jgi:hypothetical protein
MSLIGCRNYQSLEDNSMSQAETGLPHKILTRLKTQGYPLEKQVAPAFQRAGFQKEEKLLMKQTIAFILLAVLVSGFGCSGSDKSSA